MPLGIGCCICYYCFLSHTYGMGIVGCLPLSDTWSWSGNGFKMGTEQRILTEKGTELYKASSTQETVGSTQETHRQMKDARGIKHW